ncbi:ARM repeat-containing protein [Phlegmacium glaucopus]|nr:ARM repeat-containing protein [Phlegmacium glaucopus]
MPRENRKRGKKHKKQPEHEPEQQANSKHEEEQPEPIVGSLDKPSWIVPGPKQDEEVNPEAPYGFVDADVKAYFRTVDVQIRDWQENRDESTEEGGDTDPNEQKRLFFIAALSEMHGKEKQLATDPDCSVVIERMTYSMDDFVRRVFVDSLTGSYETLVRHRFASHVCQTLFTVSKDTISRETKGIMPIVPDSLDQGELPSLTQLILDVIKELLPNFPSLVMDPFASHVIRSMLLLLSPNLSAGASRENTQFMVRSKKSATWKAKQGVMKSVFVDDKREDGKGKGKENKSEGVPPEFSQMARRIIEVFRSQVGDNEVRAMAASKVACPGLQMLLEVEADQNMHNEPGSLMDRVMVGMITACRKGPLTSIDESDYVGTLLRDPNSSRLLEIIATHCPSDAFDLLWKTYFKGKLPRLAVHTAANFVVAKAIERLSEVQLSEACDELENTWNKVIHTAKTGVLRAVIERAAIYKTLSQSISVIVSLAFGITDPADRTYIVPCVLTLFSLQDYRKAQESLAQSENQNTPHRNAPHSRSNLLRPQIQGSVLLQSLLRLPDPHNQFVIESIFSLSFEERIKIAQDPSGSRVFDVLLDSSTVLAKFKRQFVLDFIGHYDVLLDDKLGSRVVDRCWAFCDTYLKEKIARSLITKEQVLAASYFGKFFARNLNLHLLQRRPEEWRNLQSERKRSQGQHAAPTESAPVIKTLAEQAPSNEHRKRKSRPEDEIDALFNAKLGKRVKKAALSETTSTSDGPSKISAVKEVAVGEEDKELEQVLGAIRLAPKDDGQSKKKQKRR